MPPDALLQLPAQVPSVPTHQHLPSLLLCPRLRFYLQARVKTLQPVPCLLPASLVAQGCIFPLQGGLCWLPEPLCSQPAPPGRSLRPQTSCGEGAECSWGHQGALGNGAALDVTSPSWTFPATNKIQAEDPYPSCFRWELCPGCSPLTSHTHTASPAL